MKTLIKLAMVSAMSLALMVACSQKSSEQQAKAQAQERQAQSAPQAPAQEPAALQQAQQPAVQEPSQQVASEQPQAEAAPAEQAAATPEEISGTIVKTEEGIALFSDSGNFMIAGQQLDSLVGKNVKVTGTIEEGSGKPMIKVTSVSVIE
jgi:glucose/arabinose dehydrogenase